MILRYIYRVTILLIFSLNLIACVSAVSTDQTFNQKLHQQKEFKAWRASGALGVKTKDQGFSANYIWRYQNRDYTLQLFGPLGAWHAVVAGSGDRASLTTSDGQHLSSEQAAEYMNEKLGWALPVNFMSCWLVGLPDTHYPYQIKLDENHRLTRLEQAGWSVSYKDYYSFASKALARQIILQRPGVNIKIILQDWQTL